MLFPLVTLLCTLTIVLASSLDSLASLPSPPTLSSASSALDTSITHSKANHVDRDTMYSFSDQNNEKRFEKRLKKRCFYIGTFFQKIDCNAPTNSTEVPYAPRSTVTISAATGASTGN